MRQLDDIKAKGLKINADIVTINSRLENGKNITKSLSVEIAGLQCTLDSIKIDASGPQKTLEELTEEELNKSAAYKAKKDELVRVSLKATGFKPPVPSTITTDEELKSRRDAINEQIRSLQGELAKESQIAEGQKRIAELRDQEATLAQALADLEGQEYAILQFTKSKVDAIERKINGKFKFVKFKMFNQQVNGGESETCETLVNSNGSFVPFTDANNAARINSGIDIINTLCQHYDVYAPIFIDNRESVTELIESDSQIVNLIVSAADKKLRVI
jgi:chromosome segregation ATPase